MDGPAPSGRSRVPKAEPGGHRMEPTTRERDLSGHIFSVSSGLVGACLTVVGLFNLL